MLLNFSHSCSLRYSAQQVWRIAGSFGTLHHIHSGTVSSSLEDGGTVRLLATQSGALLWERLLSYSENDRSLSYQIIDTKSLLNCPYGRGYVGEIRISVDGPHSSTFHYTGSFEPLDGYGEAESAVAIRQFAEDCAQGIGRVLQNQQ